MNDPDVINDVECAALLDCTVDQVRELAGAGEIPGLKIGRPWRFIRSDLIAYLAEKARAEAEERRSKRAVREMQALAPIKQRRRVPPSLAFVRQE
jgi:excisionase family DNA binding protein